MYPYKKRPGHLSRKGETHVLSIAIICRQVNEQWSGTNREVNMRNNFADSVCRNLKVKLFCLGLPSPRVGTPRSSESLWMNSIKPGPLPLPHRGTSYNTANTEALHKLQWWWITHQAMMVHQAMMNFSIAQVHHQNNFTVILLFKWVAEAVLRNCN